MQRSRSDERYFYDLQQAYEVLHDVLAPRGLYVETSLLLVDNLRRPAVLRDVGIGLVVRARSGGPPVWHASESLRIPGRMKLRSLASALFGLMMRATYDIESLVPLPGEDRP